MPIPAERLFAAQVEFMAAEEALKIALTSAIGFEPSHIGFDYYDASVELYGCPVTWLTPEQVEAVRALGVKRIWAHVAQTPDEPNLGTKTY